MYYKKRHSKNIWESLNISSETSQDRPLSPVLLSIFLDSRVQPEHFTKSREPTCQNSKVFSQSSLLKDKTKQKFPKSKIKKQVTTNNHGQVNQSAHYQRSININLVTIPSIYIGNLVQQQHKACGTDQPRYDLG